MSQETESPYEDIPAKLNCWDVFSILGYPIEAKKGKFKSPFRDDRTPSFSVYNDAQKWKDHATGERGDIFDLVILCKGCDKKGALRFLAEMAGFTLVNDRGGLPIPPRRQKASRRPPKLPDVIDPDTTRDLTGNAVRDLDDRAGVLWELLAEKKGISAPTINRLVWEGSIGSAGTGQKPEGGRHRQELLYLMERGIKCRPIADTSHRDFWVDGMGSNNLFRGQAILDNPGGTVFITEGETDCIAALDKLTEIRCEWTGALGASWVPDFRVARRYLKDRRVFIIGDYDKAGGEFGSRLKTHLLEVAGVVSAQFFNWPTSGLDVPEGTDLGDMLKPGNDLQKRIDQITFSLRRKDSWI